MLKEHTIADVTYRKPAKPPAEGAEVTERAIIPTYIPWRKHLNVKAVDVTGLSDDEQRKIEIMLREYGDYVEEQRKTLLTFENFFRETHNVEPPTLRYRTFNPEQLTEL